VEIVPQGDHFRRHTGRQQRDLGERHGRVRGAWCSEHIAFVDLYHAVAQCSESGLSAAVKT
jgi:hypothetical protein